MHWLVPSLKPQTVLINTCAPRHPCHNPDLSFRENGSSEYSSLPILHSSPGVIRPTCVKPVDELPAAVASLANRCHEFADCTAFALGRAEI